MILYKQCVVNIQKLENWIESNRKQGYRLVKVNPYIGRYEFAKSNEGEFIPKVRIDFRTFEKKDAYQDYLCLFEDSGWHCLYGDRSNGFQYFEQMHESASDDIFSDKVSKAARYKRLSAMWLFWMTIYIPIVVVSNTGLNKWYNFVDPKTLYYTPELWERHGLKFWFAFLFETPFALIRGGFVGGFLMAILLLFFILFLRTYYLYRKEKKLG